MELWGVFSQFAVGIVSYAITTVVHVYFIAVTFAGSRGRYLNTRHSGLAFKHFLGTRQILMHEKPWVIPILIQRHDVKSTLNVVSTLCACWAHNVKPTWNQCRCNVMPLTLPRPEYDVVSNVVASTLIGRYCNGVCLPGV